jgi:hypothetical protein
MASPYLVAEAACFAEEDPQAVDHSEEAVAPRPEYEESWARELAESPEYGARDRAWSVAMNFLTSKGVDVDVDDLLVSRLYQEAADIFQNETKGLLPRGALQHRKRGGIAGGNAVVVNVRPDELDPHCLTDPTH